MRGYRAQEEIVELRGLLSLLLLAIDDEREGGCGDAVDAELLGRVRQTLKREELLVRLAQQLGSYEAPDG